MPGPGWRARRPQKVQLAGAQSSWLLALRLLRICNSEGLARELSQDATRRRENNPHVTCEGWLRRGQWPADRMATYKWNNRFSRMDAQDLFTPGQEQLAFEANRSLGQTFGLKPKVQNRHKPGDRYIHTLHAKASEKNGGRLDPSKMSPAGEPTHSVILDGQRWTAHNAMIKNGNQRTAY
mmetsp:Transcript_8915/g.27111  ORF Transcript_8915/g.27111 Transcript_8915/m.27111 type:complete len:180 (-) Transcript_8915:174-713(-)